jgi:hypothetical protein
VQISPELWLIIQALGLGSLLASLVSIILKEYFAWRARKDAYRMEVSKIMLRKIYESLVYYFRLLGSAVTLSHCLGQVLENPNDYEARKHAFRCFIYFYVEYQIFWKKLGGYFLKSYDVETNLVSIISRIDKELKKRITRRDLNIAVMRALAKRWTEQYFLIDEDSAFKDVRDDFEKWLQDIESVKKVKDLLLYYHYLLVSELNRIFRIWHEGKPPEIPRELLGRVNEVLAERA